MMELYQAFADYNDVMDITEELVTQAARDALGTTVHRRSADRAGRPRRAVAAACG